LFVFDCVQVRIFVANKLAIELTIEIRPWK